MGTYLGDANLETDRLVVNAIKESVRSHAINLVDTAINYRFQKAERSVSAALGELISSRELNREELFISTKNGYLTHDGDLDVDFWTYMQRNLINPGVISPEDIGSHLHCMTVTYLKDQLERSLKNLNLKCVDLIYLHNAAESQIPEIGKAAFMEKLEDVFELYEHERSKGKIQFYGMATWTCFRTAPANQEHLNLADLVDLAERIGGKEHGFRFIQLPYNLAMREAYVQRNQTVNGEKLSLLGAAAKLQVGVFASIPLLQGQILTTYRIPNVKDVKSPTLVALQFVRSTPVGIIAPLVGHKRPDHIRENLQLARIEPLDVDEFNRLFF